MNASERECSLVSELVDLSTTVAWCEAERSFLRVSGTDAEVFLQGQLSQDIAALQARQSAWSLILQPQGRIDAFVRVNRLGADDFILDTDCGLEALVQRLERFMLRVKVTLTPHSWRCLSIRGPAAMLDTVKQHCKGEVLASVPVGGFDVLGVNPEVAAATVQMNAATLEAHRITNGWPSMSKDIDQRTIPAEAGVVPYTVSFTKGCFTGQELVARMDARSNTAPRYLRVLTFASPTQIASGDMIYAAAASHHNSATNSSEMSMETGSTIGTVTSTALDAVANKTVALGYIKRAVAMPAQVNVANHLAYATATERNG